MVSLFLCKPESENILGSLLRTFDSFSLRGKAQGRDVRIVPTFRKIRIRDFLEEDGISVHTDTVLPHPRGVNGVKGRPPGRKPRGSFEVGRFRRYT
jgi:hypothetical protein